MQNEHGASGHCWVKAIRPLNSSLRHLLARILTACEGIHRTMRQAERPPGWQAVLVVSRCAFTGRVGVRLWLLPARPTVVEIGLAGSLQMGGLQETGRNHH